MPAIGTLLYYSAIVAYSAVVYQFFIKDLLTVTVGLGRVIQSIDEFPYSCQRVEYPQLEACEDLWLDHETRTLYAACAGTKSRMAWSPAISRLNVTGRRASGAEFIAIDIDQPISPENLRKIQPTGSFGALGTSTLDIVGFTAEITSPDTIHFYFTHVPPYQGTYFDAATLGANASVEIFSHTRGSTEMAHERTVYSPAIWSPNRPAALGNGAFLLTNDHGAKVGWRKQLEPLIGGGTIAYCSASGTCHSATTPPSWDIRKNLKFPNGLARGDDGLIYVPSSADGSVRVFSLQPNQTLQLLHTIRVGMPLDNLSPDARGDLWVPGFPDMRKALKGLGDPYAYASPATVFRIRKVRGEVLQYEVKKILEDKDSAILNGATTVLHDIKTGNLYIGAAASPYLVVCEPRA